MRSSPPATWLGLLLATAIGLASGVVAGRNLSTPIPDAKVLPAEDRLDANEQRRIRESLIVAGRKAKAQECERTAQELAMRAREEGTFIAAQAWADAVYSCRYWSAE